MIIIKKVQGHDIKLELEKIKEFKRYSVYQVYKLKNNERIPLYKTSYSDMQIIEIIKNKNIITEEEFI